MERADRETPRDWLWASLWALVVALVLLLPAGFLPGRPRWVPSELLPWLDDVVHAALFGVLAWLAWPPFESRRSRRKAGLLLLGCGAYALLLELAQVPIPTRGFELSDLVAGVLGAGAGLWARASVR
jgi:VanZ family protein